MQKTLLRTSRGSVTAGIDTQLLLGLGARVISGHLVVYVHLGALYLVVGLKL